MMYEYIPEDEMREYVGRCDECLNSVWSDEEYFTNETTNTETGEIFGEIVCDNCLGD